LVVAGLLFVVVVVWGAFGVLTTSDVALYVAYDAAIAVIFAVVEVGLLVMMGRSPQSSTKFGRVQNDEFNSENAGIAIGSAS